MIDLNEEWWFAYDFHARLVEKRNIRKQRRTPEICKFHEF
jgi:YD repeat-containing protein